MGGKMRQSLLWNEATPVTDKDAEVVADSRVNCANVIEWNSWLIILAINFTAHRLPSSLTQSAVETDNFKKRFSVMTLKSSDPLYRRNFLLHLQERPEVFRRSGQVNVKLFHSNTLVTARGRSCGS
jgi:hypothetical protein